MRTHESLNKPSQALLNWCVDHREFFDSLPLFSCFEDELSSKFDNTTYGSDSDRRETRRYSWFNYSSALLPDIQKQP